MDNKNIEKDVILDDPRKFFSDALVELGMSNPDVLYISCDSSLGASGAEFAKRYPGRHFEMGIAEQNAMGHAAGFATCGKIPFIAAYLPFVTLRCFEQVRDDVCKTGLNVNIMGNNCGFSVSALGPTHTVLEDIGVMRSLPNITILSPCDGPEYFQAAIAAAEIKGPVFLRIHRQKIKRIHEPGFKFICGKGEILKKGSDATVITFSSMVPRVLEASGILDMEGISLEIINMTTLKPVDSRIILESVSKTGKAVTVEEHSVVNGLGSAVADILIKENPVKMKMIGTNDVFSVVGEYDEMLEYYDLTGNAIAGSIKEFVTDYNH